MCTAEVTTWVVWIFAGPTPGMGIRREKGNRRISKGIPYQFLRGPYEFLRAYKFVRIPYEFLWIPINSQRCSYEFLCIPYDVLRIPYELVLRIPYEFLWIPH